MDLSEISWEKIEEYIESKGFVLVEESEYDFLYERNINHPC